MLSGQMLFLQCMIIYCCAIIIYCAKVDFNFHERIVEGENRYNELTKKIAPYGECWKKALAELQLGCKHLTEDTQSRLALSFANCFLQHSGSKVCVCPEDVPISHCLGNSSDRIFATYTEFFTHTQSVCHYLQHREWQEQTELTVLKLTESSDTVIKKLEQSSESQSRILYLQQVAFKEQNRLISNGRILNSELQKSRNHAKNVFEEFKASTEEQKFLIFEVFDLIKQLHNIVLGEFTGVYTFVCYLIGAIVIYMLTSIPRTANARLWLLLLISFNLTVERAITSYTLDEEMSKLTLLDANGPIYYRIWLCRKLACTIGFAILIFFYYNYKDYDRINNQLLKEIQQQNHDLQMFIKSLHLAELPKYSIETTKCPVQFKATLSKQSAFVTLKDMKDNNSVTSKGNTSPLYDFRRNNSPVFKNTIGKLDDTRRNNSLVSECTVGMMETTERINPLLSKHIEVNFSVNSDHLSKCPTTSKEIKAVLPKSTPRNKTKITQMQNNSTTNSDPLNRSPIISREAKAVSQKLTPKNKAKVTEAQSMTTKEITTQEFQDASPAELLSPGARRYNLRTRVNSPVTSPFVSKSP